MKKQTRYQIIFDSDKRAYLQFKDAKNEVIYYPETDTIKINGKYNEVKPMWNVDQFHIFIVECNLLIDL